MSNYVPINDKFTAADRQTIGEIKSRLIGRIGRHIANCQAGQIGSRTKRKPKIPTVTDDLITLMSIISPIDLKDFL